MVSRVEAILKSGGSKIERDVTKAVPGLAPNQSYGKPKRGGGGSGTDSERNLQPNIVVDPQTNLVKGANESSGSFESRKQSVLRAREQLTSSGAASRIEEQIRVFNEKRAREPGITFNTPPETSSPVQQPDRPLTLPQNLVPQNIPGRETISNMPTQRYYEDYEKFNLTPITIAAGLGKAAERVTLKGFEKYAPEYEGGTISVPEQPIYQSATLIDSGLPTEKSPFVIPKSEIKFLTPTSISKGVGIATTTAGVVGLYSIPIIREGLLAGDIYSGGKRALTPTPKAEIIVAEARPEGVTSEDYAAYLLEVRDYNLEQVRLEKKGNINRVLGGAQAVAASAFLAADVFSILRQPIVIRNPKPTPKSTFNAQVIGSGKNSISKIELTTITPPRTGYQSNVGKELLFFGSGKNIDLIKPIVISPGTVRITQAEFLNINNKISKGVAIPGRPQNILTKTIRVPSGVSPSDFQGSFPQLSKPIKQKVFKPFEIEAVNRPVTLTAYEKDIIQAIQGGRPISRSGVNIISVKGGPNRFLASDVRFVKGVPGTSQPLVSIGPKGSSNLLQVKSRTTKITSSGEPLEIFFPSRPQTFLEGRPSLQITKVSKTPFLTDVSPTGTFQTFKATVGSQGIGARGFPTGKISIIPGQIKIFTDGGSKLFSISKTTSGKAATQAAKQISRAASQAASLSKILPKPGVIVIPAKSGTQAVLTSATVPLLGAQQVTPLTARQRPEVPIGVVVVETKPKEPGQIPGLDSPTRSSSGQDTGLIQIPNLDTILIPDLGQVPGQVQIPGTGTTQRGNQGLRLSSLQNQNQFGVFGFPSQKVPGLKTPIPTETNLPFISFEEDELVKKKRRGRKISSLFVPEIRKRGRFSLAGGPSPFYSAVSRGQSLVQNSLAASFRIRDISSGRLVRPTTKSPFFSPSKREPFVSIQKRSFRLSSPSERSAIQRARKRGRNIFF